MYLSSARQRDPSVAAATAGRAGTRVATNVVALGAVSLITDISSEMVTAVLPLYLVTVLRLTPVQYGLVDGLYTGATSVFRLLGGYLADRRQWRKRVAGFGYALSALCKLGLVAVGRSATGIGLVLALDRAGKGLRTAPRDALITLSSPPHLLGRAFGLHRAMDTAGAFLGPLAAFGLLWILHDPAEAYDALYVVSCCLGLVAVVVLVLFVRDRTEGLPGRQAVSARAAFGLLRGGAFRRVCLAALVLGAVTIGDGFVYLLLADRLQLSARYFPLLAVAGNLVFLALAFPLGALADRWGRRRVVLGGYLCLTAVYTVLNSPLVGAVLLVTVVVLYGAFYAATDGVWMAFAGPLLPAELRTTGLALVQTGQALTYLVSSVAFGAAWSWWGTGPAVWAAAGAAAVAFGGSALLLAGRGGDGEQDQHDGRSETVNQR